METIRQFLLRPWLYLVIVIIGTSLKFYRVDYRFFWFDETSTILHTSGIADKEYDTLVPVNEIKSITWYQDLLKLNKQNYTVASQLKGLSRMTNLNPLHYALLVFWHRIAGDDTIHYRLFNVFLFILIIPVLFMLAKTLFQSDLAGWIAVSLLAVSPLFHFYAHEARYNMLLAFLLILSHYFFILALRHDKIKWWIGYSIAGILLLYTSILAGLAIIGHFIYVMIVKRELRIKYIISAGIIFLGYLPWLISVINKRSEILAALDWHKYYGTDQIWRIVIFQLSDLAHMFMSFLDFKHYHQLILRGNLRYQENYIELAFNFIVLVIIICSIVYAFRKSAKDLSFFMLLAVMPHYLFMLVSDLVRKAGMSLYWRYHVIYYIGILLFMANYLYIKIKQGNILYSGIYIGLIITGLISVSQIAGDRFFDVYINCEQHAKEAQILSVSRKALFISDFSNWNGCVNAFFPLVNECKSPDIDIFRVSKEIENIEEMIAEKGYSDIYVAYSSSELVENLRIKFAERMDSLEIEGINPMWKINL